MAIRFSVLTLFPGQVKGALDHSITGRAIDRGLIEIETIDIRNFAVNDYGQVDDAPYGGGRGMVMMCEPVYRAWQSACHEDPQVKTLYLSPAGNTFNYEKAQQLAQEKHLILICGHYEGIDRRVLDEIGVEEVSIGDFVLTGGELAAAVMIDAISRLIEGVLPHQEAWQQDSFTEGLLEWPQYTRPAVWRDRAVPEVLLSGHQARIERERQLTQIIETLKKKPELLKERQLDPETWELIAERLESEASGDHS